MTRLRYRPLLDSRTAPLAHRVIRAARSPEWPSSDHKVERFVSRRHRLLAAPVPKVASRTIQEMMGRLSPPDMVEVHESPDAMREHFGDLFAFSFVRNPWARIYSCWADKIEDAFTVGKVLILSRFAGLRPFMPFEEFVEWLETEAGSDAHADRHWLSQTEHLRTSSGEPIVDFVGRMEAFEEGLAEIERRSGVTLPRVEALNVKTSSDAYRVAYSPRARSIVGSRYLADIETYGYVF